MTSAKDLVDKLASLEGGRSEMFAPVLSGGKVVTRVDGLVRRWNVQQKNFEGFAIVHPIDDKTVAIIDTPRPAQIERYLERLPAVRMILVKPWKNRTWLALAWNATDVGQRFGTALAGVAVHLVSEGKQFDVVVARMDGRVLWFHELDRSADQKIIEALRKGEAPKGSTPGQRAAQALAYLDPAELVEEKRIKKQIEMAGGKFIDLEDRDDHWLVSLADRNGIAHTMAVQKRNHTIMSAGICLSGRDRDFDLASIVGVVSEADH